MRKRIKPTVNVDGLNKANVFINCKWLKSSALLTYSTLIPMLSSVFCYVGICWLIMLVLLWR